MSCVESITRHLSARIKAQPFYSDVVVYFDILNIIPGKLSTDGIYTVLDELSKRGKEYKYGE